MRGDLRACFITCKAQNGADVQVAPIHIMDAEGEQCWPEYVDLGCDVWDDRNVPFVNGLFAHVYTAGCHATMEDVAEVH